MAQQRKVPAMFLLGAGASREAGLPLSTEITDRMLSEFAASRYRSISAAMNFVVGVMIAHDARSGGRPDQLPDVERVASAVELLANRGALEVAPFVTNWDAALDGFERGGQARPPFIKNEMERALGVQRGPLRPRSTPPTPNAQNLIDAVEKIVDARIAGQAIDVFGRLLSEMIGKLRSILGFEDNSAFDYLAPILRFGSAENPLIVCTLNYDLGFESMAKRSDRPVARGVEGWSETGTLDFSHADVHLVKLHGSLDWLRRSGYREGKLAQSWLTIDADPGKPAEPSLVFGQREKLRAPGPFLELLEKFREGLAQSRDLVVIGYAFRDDHINEGIARWLDAGGKRLVVVDPGFPDPDHYAIDRSDFRQLLMRTLDDPSKAPFQDGDQVAPNSARSELRVLRQDASTFIGAMSQDDPHNTIDNLFGL